MTDVTLPAGSVLDKQVHERLILDLPHVCEVAGVPPRYVHQSMKTVCHAQEIDWVANYNQNRVEGIGGVVLTGAASEDRGMAITGALLRNFIDARFITLNQLIDGVSKGDVPDPSVMVIPNLFVVTPGKGLTSWQIQSLYDVLLARYTASKPTVVYVQSMNGLADAYGKLIHDHLQNHFVIAD